MIGGVSKVCSEKVVVLYKIFVKGECIVINVCMVEMVKLIENLFCDVNIVFVNEFFLVCNKLKINVWELICLVNCYFCVSIFNLGFGVGGYCIVVDLWFIVNSCLDEV